MMQVRGIWLPDGEQHLAGMPVENYQGEKREAALAWVKQWRTAVDVGAHVGLWSLHLQRRFTQVHAFEPVAANRECFGQNVRGDVILYPCALGEREGRTGLVLEAASSASACVIDGAAVPMHQLDFYDFAEVDFLKVDCCGYELPVLKGAVETLKRWQPCVSVEQKRANVARMGQPALGAVEFLKSLGAVVRHENGDVFVLSWE